MALSQQICRGRNFEPINKDKFFMEGTSFCHRPFILLVQNLDIEKIFVQLARRNLMPINLEKNGTIQQA